ncbi:MAG: transglutaminase-like domain-containing protein [Gemmataceae bacterium]|nr:transglutaminase-like domain-containing protein [Gemmataceae bacterium]
MLASCLILSVLAAEPPARKERPDRAFEFTYAAIITGLPAGKKAKVWVPVPSSTDHQAAEAKDKPEGGSVSAERVYGNRMWHARLAPSDKGEISLRFTYRVKRKEVRGETEAKETAAQLKRFLQADALVPVEGKPLELIKDKKLPEDPMAKAKLLYETVNRHMKYSKEGEGWGRGDSAWACDSKFGNCSDFHSLFISLARSQNLPAKFEMGFPLPEKRGEGTIGGYHCWAFFAPDGKKWVPVDISEANKDPKMAGYHFGNLTPDRVAFSTGRDIDLVPKQSGKPVNFLIYPHVEVDGKEWPQDKIKKEFGYKDEK